jgi:uncharacterized protein with FMN-binding domain
MRRIAIAVMSTISGLVLLFSYHTSTGQSGTAGTLGAAGSGNGSGVTDPDASGSSGPAGDDSAGDDSPREATSSTGSTGNGSSGSTAVTGDSVQTRWGPVQVRITVKNGKIVTSEAIAYPNSNRHDVKINSYAVPILNQQAVEAQSADIDGVSGATVTSGGYEQSLQSAIDKAHLG